jgi:hypothetical protein
MYVDWCACHTCHVGQPTEATTRRRVEEESVFEAASLHERHDETHSCMLMLVVDALIRREADQWQQVFVSASA